MDVEVEVTELMGNELFLHTLVGEQKLLARVDPRATAQVGDTIEVAADLERMYVFDPETEEAVATARGRDES
jgi:multiple sugar transport system ATP-binding protein